MLLLLLPTPLLLYFSVYAAYNYRYSIASLLPPRLKRVALESEPKVAVVIASFNEKNVIADTVAACEQLSYPNATIIVADDSSNPETVQILRGLAAARGCRQGAYSSGVELHEGDGFVLFHREQNIGFKAGSLSALEGYLHAAGFDYMYLLDADWRPQPDVVERCLELLAAEPSIAFVQTKRLNYYGRKDHFQRCLAISEEACYLVDLPGRQRLGDMILFTGCCTMFALPALRSVGGFQAGHLTEDIDLSNRLYLAGYRGVYAEHISNVGEVPPNYRAFRRQQERWAIGSARTCKEYFGQIVRSPALTMRLKGSLLRQNAYYTAALAVEASTVWAVIALLVAMSSGPAAHTSAPVRSAATAFAGMAGVALLLSAFSTILPLVVAAVKKRELSNLLYIPLTCWISMSIVHTYAIANIKGFRNVAQTWYLTPKTNRKKSSVAVRPAWKIKAVNLATLLLLAFTYVATMSTAGVSLLLVLVIGYAALWIPSMLIGAVAS